MQYIYTDSQIESQIDTFFPPYFTFSPKWEEKIALHYAIETALSLINCPPYGKKTPANPASFMKKRANLIDKKYAPLFISFVAICLQ